MIIVSFVHQIAVDGRVDRNHLGKPEGMWWNFPDVDLRVWDCAYGSGVIDQFTEITEGDPEDWSFAV